MMWIDCEIRSKANEGTLVKKSQKIESSISLFMKHLVLVIFCWVLRVLNLFASLNNAVTLFNADKVTKHEKILYSRRQGDAKFFQN